MRSIAVMIFGVSLAVATAVSSSSFAAERLVITGTDTQGGLDIVPNVGPPESHDLAGDGFHLTLIISDAAQNPVASSFVIQFTNRNLPDLPTNFGSPVNPNFADAQVNLTATGGSVSLASTAAFASHFDSGVSSNVAFTFDTPQDLSAPFLAAATGTGFAGGGLNQFFNPNVGVFDGSMGANFTVTSVALLAGVPEPGAWALMLVGFAGAGTAIRRSRRRTAA